MKANHALSGLGADYGLRVGKDSAQKSQLNVENLVPVPETDTGRQAEQTKGREITLSKEPGKMTP